VSAQPQPFITPAEYLAIERSAETKSEYFDGQMFAMAGASRKHSLIVSDIDRVLGNQLLERPCETYPTDMRVKVTATGLYTYPDFVVVCGEPQFEDKVVDTLLNPTLLVEVLSKTTENYDRGVKFEHYRRLASLREFLAIAQDRMHVEHHVRQDDGSWLLREYFDVGDVLELRSIECRLTLADVYRRVKLPQVAVAKQSSARKRRSPRRRQARG
jgi:Uma2 family endonuclease